MHYFDFGPLPALKKLILHNDRLFDRLGDVVACNQIDRLRKNGVEVTPNMHCATEQRNNLFSASGLVRSKLPPWK
jgi:hypothetical protein